MHAHSIIVEVFVKPGENLDLIKSTFIRLFPFDLKEEKITLHQKSAIGFNEQIIDTLRITLKKQRHIKAFLNNLFDKLDEDTKQQILYQSDQRLDEELYFYLRFDKHLLLEKNQFHLINEGDCFYIKFKVAAFPKKKKEALAIIDKLLK